MLLYFYYTLIIAILILYVHERQHWVATSYMDAELELYDSMFTGELTPFLDEQLFRIYLPLARDASLVITAVSVHQQSGRTDCGLFRTAFALYACSNEEEFKVNLF